MLVDTNILIDILENDPIWADWSLNQLRNQSQVHRMIINPIIFSELSMVYETLEDLEEALATIKLNVIEIPKSALFLAGRAFRQYRKRGGTKRNVLSDFFIGAQAAVSGIPIITRDPRRYATYFPSVTLISPTH
jgi:predicted nucleic acid-binding protein